MMTLMSGGKVLSGGGERVRTVMLLNGGWASRRAWRRWGPMFPDALGASC